MTPKERHDALAHRKEQGYPWHSPPHLDFGPGAYHVSAACFEHRPVIGQSSERMQRFEAELFHLFVQNDTKVNAWCILPNHYHVLLETESIRGIVQRIGQHHGRTSFDWNNEENARGRKVWFRCSNRAIRSERHFWATMNYVHNNAVHHGYVERWEDWPFSSADAFLRSVGREEAKRIWQEYPPLDYGKGWDETV